jgi:hypothetical protein
MNLTQLRFLSTHFNKEYAIVKNGIPSHALTKEIIPDNHVNKYFDYSDGVYELSKSTCGDALPLGMDKGDAKPTQENKDKYQCRIGRRAPKCEVYSKGKCAVYSFSDPDSSSISVKPSELIKVFNINNVDKF